MNDTPDPALVACVKEALARSIADHGMPPVEPPDPEMVARLERAMLSLPRTTRDIFLAHRRDGYSYARIAAITGLSVRQVKRHMAKAVLHLFHYAHGDERTAWQRWWQSCLPRWFR